MEFKKRTHTQGRPLRGQPWAVLWNTFGIKKSCGRQVLLVDRLAGGIENVSEHASCMQNDAAIELVLLVVEPHHELLGDAPKRRSRIVVAYHALNFHADTKLRLRSLFT